MAQPPGASSPTPPTRALFTQGQPGSGVAPEDYPALVQAGLFPLYEELRNARKLRSTFTFLTGDLAPLNKAIILKPRCNGGIMRSLYARPRCENVEIQEIDPRVIDQFMTFGGVEPDSVVQLPGWLDETQPWVVDDKKKRKRQKKKKRKKRRRDDDENDDERGAGSKKRRRGGRDDDEDDDDDLGG